TSLQLEYFNCIYSSCFLFFFSSRRRHTRSKRDWSSDVCSSDLEHDDEAHEHEAHEHEAHEHDHGEEGHSHEVESIDGNEHIWYDPTAVMEVAHEIAEHINNVDPAANASDEEVVNQVSGLDSRLHELGKKNYVQSEPIADYLLAHTEMEDLTPEGYRHASLSHGEPAAADLAALIDELKS